MICLTWTVLIAGFIFTMITLIRWFEQITEAVENRWWNKVSVLVVMPFTVWFFRSRISAGRPFPVPHHEPVRGFGATTPSKLPLPAAASPEPRLANLAPAPDQPPPGTPPEFLGLPKIPPPKPKSARASVDPDKIAKLKQKMRDQGMLSEDNEP